MENSFQEKVQQVEAVAVIKEADRQTRRIEAGAKRQEKWDNLVNGAKTKMAEFKKWDQDAGRQIRKAVDMTPGVVGAAVLTGQEKATEMRNVAYGVHTQVAEGLDAAGQAVVQGAEAIGRGVIRGAEIGVGLAIVSGIEAAHLVKEGIDTTVETAENVSRLVVRKSGEIRDGAIELKQNAVEGFWSAVDRVKTSFNEIRREVATSFVNTGNEIKGDIRRTITRGKERLVAIHQWDVDNKYDAMAGYHSLRGKMAGGVAEFFSSLSESASQAEVARTEKAKKFIDAKSTKLQVEAVMAKR